MTGLHLEELTEEITEQAGRLEGPLEAAALVEALHPLEAGGRPLAPGDALELGSAVFEQQSLDPESARRAAEAERRRRMAWPRRDRPRQMAGLPLLPDHRAAALVTPTVLALAAVSVATLPLWASARPRPAQATAVGLGAVASLILAAGFVFAIERATAGWVPPPIAVRRAMRMALVWLLVAAPAGVALWSVLRVLPVVPERRVGWTLFSYAALSIVWAALCLLGVSLRVRGHPRLRDRAGTHRLSIRVVARGFAYGLSLAGLLLADRVLAWAGTPHSRPLHLWFRSDYELAVGWALLSALPGFIVVGAGARRMGRLLVASAFQSPVSRRDLIASRMNASYRRTVEWLILAAVVGAGGAVAGLLVVGRAVPWVDRLISPGTMAVFAAAVLSYWLVGWGLLNQALAFRLSRGQFALWAIVPAMFADLAVGLSLAHFVAYRLAVCGLLAGAVVLWALSTRFALTVLRDPDYFFYAAF